jgi:signal transduction histidine kinase
MSYMKLKAATRMATQAHRAAGVLTERTRLAREIHDTLAPVAAVEEVEHEPAKA